MLYAIIMAGGAGTRLWPESRKNFPKQLMTLQGGRSFLQATVDRLRPALQLENIGVVTGKNLEMPIREQLPELENNAIIVEPCARNTAGCIALAALWCLERNPEAVMVLLPADHVIQPSQAFQKTILMAEKIVNQNPEKLITLGITPTYPAESFGYIERSDRFFFDEEDEQFSEIIPYNVSRFCEKPDARTAQTYLDSGKFYWNGGIFVWKARTILDCLKVYAPDVSAPIEKIHATLGTPEFKTVLAENFPKIKNISIDYAVMELAAQDERILVLPASFSWDDVGSWRAMERLFPQDADGNTIATEDCENHAPILVETQNTTIRNTDTAKTVACFGVHDLAVIVTPEVVLVFDRNREESVREVTKRLKEMNCEDLL